MPKFSFHSRSVALVFLATGCSGGADNQTTFGSSATAGTLSGTDTMSSGTDTADPTAGPTSTGASDSATGAMETGSGGTSGASEGSDTDGTGTGAGDSGSTGGGMSASGSESSESGGGTGGGMTGGGMTGDGDGDGIPDEDDPFPADPNLPGTALQGTVYAHTSGTLFTMDVVTYDINQVAPFTYDSKPGSMTDIAIDRWGVLYGVTFNNLFVCHPTTAKCYHLAPLPQSFNGLTLVPPGTMDPDDDTLVAIANSGAWYRVDLVGNKQAMVTNIGSYGGYSSSGDAFSIDGVGTFASVDKAGVSSDIIVAVNPVNGSVTGEIGQVTGFSSVYGLAGWQGAIFAFDASGKVLLLDPMLGNPMEIKTTNHTWWGAGVGTILPQ